MGSVSLGCKDHIELLQFIDDLLDLKKTFHSLLQVFWSCLLLGVIQVGLEVFGIDQAGEYFLSGGIGHGRHRNLLCEDDFVGVDIIITGPDLVGRWKVGGLVWVCLCSEERGGDQEE